MIYVEFTLIIVALVIAGLAVVYFKNVDRDHRDKFVLHAHFGRVHIHLNQEGVPEIRAEENDLDAYYGLGYMHAKHRLWQMEFQRHVVSGTLSEIFGKSVLKQDKYLRMWSFKHSAKQCRNRSLHF